MRYLIVCDYSLTFVGGAQSALLRQAEALAAQGESVAVIAPGVSNTNLSAGIARITPPAAFEVKIRGLDLPIYRNNKSLRKFATQTIEEFKPDAIISHSEFALVTAFTTAARALGVKSLHVVHTFMWHTPTKMAILAPIANGVYRYLTGLASPRQKLAKNPMDSALRNMTLATCLHADVTISPSKHQADKLADAGVRNLQVLSNVTETSGTASELPSGKILKLAWIGRFAPEKRLEVALDGVDLAKKQLRSENLDPALIELHIAGGEKRSGTEHIWHGILKPLEVAELLSSSHALVLTSLGFDNQPMVVLEAFSHGRPVILSDPILGKEFGDASILTAEPDAAGLAKTLVSILKSSNELTSSAEAATEFAKGTSAQVHVQRLREMVAATESGS